MPSFTRLDPVSAGIIIAPTAVAVDSNGRVLVAESINNRLLAYSASGAYIGELSGLNRPISVAVDDDSRIYIGNKDTGSVEVYDSAFNPLFKLGAGDGEFVQANAIAIDGSGNVYVADSGQNVIKKYNSAGAYVSSFGGYGSGDGQFNFPTSIAVDQTAGEIIVSDLHLTTDEYGNVIEGSRIQIFDMNGVFKRGFGQYGVGPGFIAKPIGLAVDKGSRIYISDSQQHVVHVFDNNGNSLGTLYDETVPMRTPMGITISKSNKLYIASLSTGKVEVFGLDSYTNMLVAPLSLVFEGNSVHIPGIQNVGIINSGTQVLNWTAETGTGWITLSSVSGTVNPSSTSVIDIGIDLTGLSTGSYTGSITVVAESGDTETVNVELTVLPTPILSVTPSYMEFTSVNGSVPVSQELSVTNRGEGTLKWSALSNNGWISVDKASGTGSGTINVTVDPSSKTSGTYSGTITLTGENALSSPLTINIVLKVVKETGRINVTSNIADAKFIINGPQSYTGSGTNWSVSDAPAGTYTIVFGNIDGYIKPFTNSKVLYRDGGVDFTGVYIYIPIDGLQIRKHIITGAGPSSQNDGLVKVFDSDGNEAGVNFVVPGHGYGVNVAAGDINFDGIDEIITAPGPGPDNASQVRIYNLYGNEIAGMGFTAFDYAYGANVASGDFNGDGYHEVVAGAGAGAENPAEVKIFVFDPSNNRMVDSGLDLLAYDTGYGVKVAAGDIDGDGIDELITAPGPGQYNKGRIRIWEVDTSSGVGYWGASLSHEFNSSYSYGYSVNIAGGDLNGDGFDEVITGAGPDRRARDDIKVFYQDGSKLSEFRANIIRNFGANVGSGDLDGDGFPEIVVGSGYGPRNKAIVKIFDVNGQEHGRFEALDMNHGVNIAVGYFGF